MTHMVTCMPAERSMCESVTIDFRSPRNTDTINGLTGIPDEARVEIRCDCKTTGPKGTPEWSYNGESLPKSPPNDDDPYVDSRMAREILRVDSFEEDSSGLYTCNGGNVTIELNLFWYDPSK